MKTIETKDLYVLDIANPILVGVLGTMPIGMDLNLERAQVRDLANQTTRLAEEIGDKITTIQSETRFSLAAIGQIREVINQINDVSGSSAGEVREQSVATNEIKGTLTQATMAGTEIADNISDIAQRAKKTFQGAGEVQTAAEGLSRTASDLRKFVDQFKY